MLQRGTAQEFGANFAPGLMQHYMEAETSSEAFARWRGAAATLSYLPPDANVELDQRVIEVGSLPLTLVQEFIDLGLYTRIEDWIGVTVLQTDAVGRTGFAQRGMVPVGRNEFQKGINTRRGVPFFITWDDWQYNAREIAASVRAGRPLPTQSGTNATLNVSTAVEDQAVNGAGFTIDGNSAPGLLSSPNVMTYESNAAWSTVGKTGDDILVDFAAMVAVNQGNGYPGPYVLGVNSVDGAVLFRDYKANGDLTIADRIAKYNYGGRPVKPLIINSLPANRNALIQVTPNVVDVAIGIEPTPATYVDPSGWIVNGMVLACMVTRYFPNAEGDWGVVVGNV